MRARSLRNLRTPPTREAAWPAPKRAVGLKADESDVAAVLHPRRAPNRSVELSQDLAECPFSAPARQASRRGSSQPRAGKTREMRLHVLPFPSTLRWGNLFSNAARACAHSETVKNGCRPAGGGSPRAGGSRA